METIIIKKTDMAVKCRDKFSLPINCNADKYNIMYLSLENSITKSKTCQSLEKYSVKKCIQAFLFICLNSN